MIETISLRGHHIEALAERYAKQRGLFPIEETSTNPTLYQISPHPNLEKIDLYATVENTFQNNLVQDDDILGIKRKHQILFPLTDQWLSNPELQVRIVFGIDSLCSSCPLLPEGCKAEGKDNKQDSVALQEYGFDSDRIYTMRQLIEIIEDYYTKTGFPSARTKNGFGRQYILTLL